MSAELPVRLTAADLEEFTNNVKLDGTMVAVAYQPR